MLLRHKLAFLVLSSRLVCNNVFALLSLPFLLLKPLSTFNQVNEQQPTQKRTTTDAGSDGTCYFQIVRGSCC